MKFETRDLFRKYTNKETFEKIIEFDTVTDMWTNCVNSYAENVAIVCNGEKYTYKTVEKDVANYRGVFRNAGLQKGDKIAIIVPNSYDFVKAYLAATTSGITAMIMPPHLDPMTVFGCCMKFGLKAVVCSEATKDKTTFVKEKAPHVAVLETTLTSKEDIQAIKTQKDDVCVYMFTGGTTGKSKCAALTNQAVMQGTVNGCYGYEDVFEQRYLLVLPLFHVFGLIRNLMTSLYTGSALFICLNNKDMFRDVAMFKPTIMVMVPALADMALNLSKKFGKNMLGADLKYIICGAAAVAPYLVQAYETMGIKLFPGYGLTESANLVSGNAEASTKSNSVGIPFPHQEFRIENGELWLKGLNMMNGYVADEEENKNAYEDGWFKTGDLVRLDDEGFLYITGRVKELIILDNGENISPAALEAKFNEITAIQDSQVFEDVTESGTHILALEVVPRLTELQGMSQEQINQFLMSEIKRVNATFPSFEQVSKIEIRDKDFERTPSMKIVRYKKCK